jgi:hypothetical protein
VIRKDDRVFFADNSKDYLERCGAFTRTARGLGLSPVTYGGAGTAVRQSNQDREMRDDFYCAQAIVLYFGAPKDGSNHEDHWVLPEIKHCISGVDCLLYLSEDFPLSVLQNHGYVGQPKVLSGGEDFGAALQNDLQKLMGHDT